MVCVLVYFIFYFFAILCNLLILLIVCMHIISGLLIGPYVA